MQKVEATKRTIYSNYLGDDLPMLNLDSELDVSLQPNSKLRRWKRCPSVVDIFMQQMNSRLYFFNGEEKQEIIKKFIKHQGVVNYVSHCARFG